MADNRRGFAGLRVAAFESRRASEMAALIERFGGVRLGQPLDARSGDRRKSRGDRLRPSPDHRPDRRRHLPDRRRHAAPAGRGRAARRSRSGFWPPSRTSPPSSAGRSRSPCSRNWASRRRYRVPEPNTWREVLADDRPRHVPRRQADRRPAGIRPAERQPGRRARSPRRRASSRVKVYRWDLPEDARPAGGERAGDRRRRDRRGDVHLRPPGGQPAARGRATWNSATQLRRGMARAVVASIGPTTSEMLREFELPVDVEPEHSKMGQLVAAAAEQAAAIGRRNASVAYRPRASASRRADVAAALDPHGRPVGRRPVHAGLPPRAGRAHAHLADAAGGPLHARVSRGPREDDVPRAVQEPGAVRRGDGHGRRAAGRRRGDHLFRSAADPRTDGHGAGVRRRRRAGDPQPGARGGATSIAFRELESDRAAATS